MTRAPYWTPRYGWVIVSASSAFLFDDRPRLPGTLGSLKCGSTANPFERRVAHPIKIVSGGQTGVDRAALDAALDRGVSCGGWCPAKRLDELGTIPERYPLQILKRGSFRARTLRNVEDSDATVIFYFDELEGGTADTVAFCLKLKKPFKLIDAAQIPPQKAVEQLAIFAAKHRVSVLNVAGPRESKEPRGYRYTYDAISGLLGQSL